MSRFPLRKLVKLRVINKKKTALFTKNLFGVGAVFRKKKKIYVFTVLRSWLGRGVSINVVLPTPNNCLKKMSASKKILNIEPTTRRSIIY